MPDRLNGASQCGDRYRQVAGGCTADWTGAYIFVDSFDTGGTNDMPTPESAEYVRAHLHRKNPETCTRVDSTMAPCTHSILVLSKFD